jgi:type II secretory ATPase GspE/PulE/Tfp pilus assembly ATPase PilB-like protein
MDLSTESIEAMILMIFLWLFCFVLAPGRAFRVGVSLDEIPVQLKMRWFKYFSLSMLLLFLGIGYRFPVVSNLSLTSADWGTVIYAVLGMQVPGLVLLPVLLIVLLFLVPAMTARGRIRNDEEPGEWLTPPLVYYRWVMLGLALVACTGYYAGIEIFYGFLPYPMPLFWGILIPVSAALFYLVYWGIPGMKINSMADQGHPRAIDSLPRIRWTGLAGYLRFVISERRKNGIDDSVHKLCTSCMRVVDNLQDYENLEFDKCPHCEEIIPPVFTLEDYIINYSDLIGKTGENARRGKAATYQSDMVQRMLRAIFVMALRERSTDIHLLSEEGKFMVRCRTDGVLFTMLELPEPQQRMMINSIKAQSQMDISERRKPQDGAYKTSLDGKPIDVRVTTSPTAFGETASLRLLYRGRVLGSLDRLGLKKRQYPMVKALLQRPHGLILVTGPTGSGKSTTLYNCLGDIADGKRNIITLEDPIEFNIDGLTQMQINIAKKFTFASGLRSILRQDPDVIMIGEIRDDETAKMTIDAAMTGHLVFSTLHTIDTTTTIGRLSDLGVDAHRHAEAILAIISQRLIRLNCMSCSTTYTMTAQELAELDLPGAPETMTLKQGRGCPVCHDSGYYEREGIYEVLSPNSDIRRLIAEKSSPLEVRAAARKAGMRTLLEEGLIRVMLGRTTVHEILRVTS